jgi:hypothetical protein
VSDGYETVATTGVNLLLSPFPADVVQQRAGPGGRSFSYIPVEVVVRRLVDSGLEWGFTRQDSEIVQHSNGVNVMLYYGTLNIPALGLPMSDVGSAFIHANGNEEQYKSAASDCLKRCARLYGIGLEMWEGDPNESDRGRPATDYQSGGSGSPTGSDQYPSRVRTVGDYGVPTPTPSHAHSNGGGAKEATDKQLAFIRRLTKERFPMDNDEFNEQAVQQIWTMELREQGQWATNRQGTSKLIEYLMALPTPDSQPRLQV